MSDKLNLPREQFEPVLSQPMEIDALGAELEIFFEDIGGPCHIKTCYGDICKIVNALRDYSRMLHMVCDEWNLQGFHRATYEVHAEALERISKKFQAGIRYDYDAAVEKCHRKMAKKSREDDVGEDAMVLMLRKAQRAADKKAGRYAAHPYEQPKEENYAEL